MDDMVKAAMAKWPTVPACLGWLGLDSRGDWYLRDAIAQHAGSFQLACGSPLPHPAKGRRLVHAGLMAFIGRNYAADADGRWHFQNGPQRVYVELASTPWVWRIDAKGHTHSHTGLLAQTVDHCLVDEHGRVYLNTDLGFGLVHSQDVALAAVCIDAGVWAPRAVESDALPRRYGYVISPAAQTAPAKKNHPA
jgi:hypothetical protein